MEKLEFLKNFLKENCRPDEKAKLSTSDLFAAVHATNKDMFKCSRSLTTYMQKEVSSLQYSNGFWLGITLKYQRCNHIMLRGKNRGKQCTAKVEEHSSRCHKHNKDYTLIDKDNLVDQMSKLSIGHTSGLRDNSTQPKDNAKVDPISVIGKGLEYIGKQISKLSKENDDKKSEAITHTKKRRLKRIPQSVKDQTWALWCGKDNMVGRCYCCTTNIRATGENKCHYGHWISEKNNGPTIKENLRPICSNCNLSMSSTNMDTFMRQYQPAKYREIIRDNIHLQAIEMVNKTMQ